MTMGGGRKRISRGMGSQNFCPMVDASIFSEALYSFIIRYSKFEVCTARNWKVLEVCHLSATGLAVAALEVIFEL